MAEESLPDSVCRDLYVILPAYNEAPTIGPVVDELTQRYAHVVVVDDGSTDDTAERARAKGAVVVRHVLNRGQGAALQTGIGYALRSGARILVTFDADGQHCPEDIPPLVRPILEGNAEITLGSRFLGSSDSIPLPRRWLLRAAVLFSRAASGLDLTDAHNGLRALSRRAAERVEITLDRMAHASELLDEIRRSGLPYAEVPVRVRYTEYSRSKGQSSLNAIPIALDYLFGRVLK